MNQLKVYIIAILMFSITFTVNAQIDKDVKVVKSYEPTVVDAFKLNQLPDFNDSVRVTPRADLLISTRRIDAKFTPKEIGAAKISPESVSPLSHSYLKLGLGNYTSPLAQLHITGLRSKTSLYGLFIDHQSSFGKVKLADGNKVKAPYSNTNAGLFGKKIIKGVVVSADAGYEARMVQRYGYNTVDTLLRGIDLDKEFTRQLYQKLFAKASVASNDIDTAGLRYETGLGYDYFFDRYDHTQQKINVDGDIGYWWKGHDFSMNVAVDHFTRNQKLDSAGGSTLLRIAPKYVRKTDDFTFSLGFKTASHFVDGESETFFYPDLRLEFNIVKTVFVPYLGVDGNLQEYDYERVSLENPFITPGLNVENANTKINFFGGFKGNISKALSYNLQGSYAQIDNFHFYVNDTSIRYLPTGSMLGNSFNVVYDNIERARVMAEIYYAPLPKFSLLVRGNYYSYTLFTEEKAWHMPDFDFQLAATYRLQNKIVFDAGLMLLSARYCKGLEQSSEKLKLDPIVQLYAGAEYRYSKTLGFFLRFDNALFQQYQLWNQYPSQRFRVMVGASMTLF